MEEIELNTYLTKDDYFKLMGINLDLEYKGTSDRDDKISEINIYGCERRVIGYLENNYDFKESDITSNEDNLKSWKLGMCFQLEHEISKGDEADTLCKKARSVMRQFLNFRRY